MLPIMIVYLPTRIRTLLHVRIPREVGRTEQSLDAVAALVLAKELGLSDATAIPQRIALILSAC